MKRIVGQVVFSIKIKEIQGKAARYRKEGNPM